MLSLWLILLFNEKVKRNGGVLNIQNIRFLYSITICIYTGCNKKIELVKYLEKCTLDQKVKKYAFRVFQKAIYRCEN